MVFASVLTGCAVSEKPMPPEKPNVNMAAYRALKNDLVNEEVARKYAAALFESRFGYEGAHVTLPLTVTDMGEIWEVTGTCPFEPRPNDPRSFEAILRVRLVKFDGRIVELVRVFQPAPGSN
jgi:hypothetical protein